MSDFLAVDLSQFCVKFDEVNGGSDKGFVADKNFQIGSVVFREQPIFTITEELLNAPKAVDYEVKFKIPREYWAFYFLFHLLDPNIKNQMKVFYRDGDVKDGSQAAQFRQRLIETGIEAKEDINIEEMVTVAIILNFNIQTKLVQNKLQPFHFFFYGTRITHSCSPNCVWSGSTPLGYTLRTIVPVEQGAVLSVNYLAEDALILPTYQRKEILRQKKELECNCARCSAEGDDTRQFQCSSGNCSGVNLVCQPVRTVTPYFLACSECRSTPSEAAQLELIKQEGEVTAMVTHMKQDMLANKPFNPAAALALPTLSATHSLTYLSAIQKCTASLATSQLRDANTHAHTAVSVLNSILKFPTIMSGNNYFLLANTYSKLSDVDNYIQIAKENCQIALQIYSLLLGRNNNTTNNMLTQINLSLLKLSEQLANNSSFSEADLKNKFSVISSHFTMNDSNHIVGECIFCGVSNNITNNVCDVKLSGCAKCKTVVYCGAACQKAHWPLHKIYCKIECEKQLKAKEAEAKQ